MEINIFGLVYKNDETLQLIVIILVGLNKIVRFK